MKRSGFAREDRGKAIHEHEINVSELELENELYRRAELALEAAHQESAALYDCAPVAYLILSRTGTIVRVNRQAARDLKTDEPDLVGGSFGAHVSRETKTRFEMHLAAMLREKRRRSCDLRLERRDGSRFWARVQSGIAPPTRRADETIFLTFDPIDDLVVVGNGRAARAPRGRIALNEDGNQSERSVDDAPTRVMVVDDEELVLKAMARLLGRLGYDVAGHTCPREALSKFSRDPAAYSAVISDFRMPNMNGLQLAEELLALQPALPIMLVSGYTGDIDPDRASLIGVDSLRSKPLSAQDLADWLGDAIRWRDGNREPTAGG